MKTEYKDHPIFSQTKNTSAAHVKKTNKQKKSHLPMTTGIREWSVIEQLQHKC